MQRNYELLVILSYEITDEEIERVTEKIKEAITKEAGEFKGVNKWGKRRLAYEINKSKKGFYLLVQFTAEPLAIKEIEQNMKFVEGVGRFMTALVTEKSTPTISDIELELPEEAV